MLALGGSVVRNLGASVLGRQLPFESRKPDDSRIGASSPPTYARLVTWAL